MEKFSGGNALSVSFKTYFKRAPVYFLITFVVYIPVSALAVWIATNPPTDLSTLAYLGAALGLLSLFLYPIATGTLVYAVFNDMRGKPVGIGESFSVGLSRLLPVIGVALVSGILILLGFFLLIVPGIIAYLVYYVAVPAAIIENTGVGASLSRSSGLTDGHRWQVLVIPVVLGVLNYIVARVLSGSGIGTALISQLLSLVFNGIGAVSGVVVYQHLRELKDGTSAEEMAAIFD